MSEIRLERRHTIGLQGAKVAAQKVADELAQSWGIESSWDGDVLRFAREGADGTLMVNEDMVVFEARLGLLLSMFRQKIEDRINEHFDRHLT